MKEGPDLEAGVQANHAVAKRAGVPYRNYSTNASDAIALLDGLRANDAAFMWSVSRGSSGSWCTLYPPKAPSVDGPYHTTVPLAICAAVLELFPAKPEPV